MKTLKTILEFGQYALDELDETGRLLVQRAIEATAHSYAPYSDFHVGAALMLDDGHTIIGANQENAAFPSGLCAERTAMFAASSRYPDKDMLSIAIAGGVLGRLGNSPATPCGACRQVMAQYQAKSGKPMSVLMVADGLIWKFDRVDDILPMIFNSI